MNIFNKIIEVSKILEQLDEFEEDISKNQQYIDYKLSDLYHRLENMTLNSKSCYRFCKELKSVLIERRELKDNIVLFSKYNSNKQKMNSGIDNRKILLSLIAKEKKSLEQPYKNRIYTEEELNEKIGD